MKIDPLRAVFKKIWPAWYPQLDANDNVIELTDVNQRNVSLETPLMIAAHLGSPEDIRILIEHGADINAASGSEQHHTALHIAYLMQRDDNVRVLIELGADQEALNIHGLRPGRAYVSSQVRK